MNNQAMNQPQQNMPPPQIQLQNQNQINTRAMINAGKALFSKLLQNQTLIYKEFKQLNQFQMLAVINQLKLYISEEPLDHSQRRSGELFLETLSKIQLLELNRRKKLPEVFIVLTRWGHSLLDSVSSSVFKLSTKGKMASTAICRSGFQSSQGSGQSQKVQDKSKKDSEQKRKKSQ